MSEEEGTPAKYGQHAGHLVKQNVNRTGLYSEHIPVNAARHVVVSTHPSAMAVDVELAESVDGEDELRIIATKKLYTYLIFVITDKYQIFHSRHQIYQKLPNVFNCKHQIHYYTFYALLTDLRIFCESNFICPDIEPAYLSRSLLSQKSATPDATAPTRTSSSMATATGWLQWNCGSEGHRKRWPLCNHGARLDEGPFQLYVFRITLLAEGG